METCKKYIVAWASFRAMQLYNSDRYKDSFAVSQEFLDWTSSYMVYLDNPKASILKVPNFNKENRTN
tara:strand:+ start:557 stop:757 length:201 start_codon:yes stop_codon:yes gene_type:complete